MTMLVVFLCFCHIGIVVLAEKHGISKTAYLKRVDNVIFNSSLLAYSEHCEDVRNAELVLLFNDGTADKRSLLYNTEEERCYVFSRSLTSSELFSTGLESEYELIYLENTCHDNMVMSSNCASFSARTHRQDCQAHWEDGVRDPGVYAIQPGNPDTDDPVDVWCDFDASHGWTVIQRRTDGTVDFYMYWADYKRGFGDLNGEYWIGNDDIHLLTAKRGNKLLKIYMQFDETGQEFEVDYIDFEIDDEENLYTILNASRDTSNMEDDCQFDAFGYHVNRPFSTRDQENDNHVSDHCAVDYEGGWWYHACFRFHPSGNVLRWYCGQEWSGLRKVTMKVSRG